MDRDLEEKSYYEFRYKRRRVVVSYSEKRKKQDQSKREKILDKLRSLEREKEISTAQLVKNIEKVYGKNTGKDKGQLEESARGGSLGWFVWGMHQYRGEVSGKAFLCIVLFGRLRSCFGSTSTI